jgi:hypothetical protein
MNDAEVVKLDVGSSPPPALPAGERLSDEVAILAGRLADLLERLPSADQGPLAESRSFLNAVYESAGFDRPAGTWRGGPLDRRPKGEPHPLDRLAASLRLSPLEVDLLILAGMPDDHEGLAGIMRLLNPGGEACATVGLAAQLFCDNRQRRLQLRATLCRGEAVQAGALLLAEEGAFSERALRLTDGLWPVLSGIDVWPAGLAPREEAVALAGLEAWFDGVLTKRALAALRRREPMTVVVSADSEEVAFDRSAALASRAGVPAVRLCPSAVTPRLERAISVHALARGVVPIVRLPAVDGPGAPEAPSLAGHPGPVVLSIRTGAASLRGPRPTISVPVDRLSPTSRRQMWSETLPELAELAPVLGARHAIEPAAAAAAAADVRSIRALEGRPIGAQDVAVSVRARAGLSVSGAVKLLKPAAGWDNLVLAAAAKAQLREALDRLVHQSRVLDDWGFLRGRPGARGVRMLFSGPPGTGKTLSAEVLAHELGVDLLVVDISRVVSKWIGETEKNLAEVFNTAEQAEALLFFDEAEALFGKRTEVSDAHDRYANLETAYLLARLERFEGMAILSTNIRQNIDQAFIRRLEFSIDFEEPGLAEREALWRCHIPDSAPLGADVSLSDLAALYPLVGGYIRNAAVAAAFLAAADGGPITVDHLVAAVRREYQKSGRAFPGAPFRNAVQPEKPSAAPGCI